MKQRKETKRAIQNRKFWFGCLKGILRTFFRRRYFLYLGEKPTEKSIIFSNHVAASGPIFFELYSQFKMRFWGTYEMTKGYKTVYKYLRVTYLHNKKHMPLWLTSILAVIIAPFTMIFYKGMKLIPTYKDISFYKTVKATEKALNSGENVIIFPEDSHSGYKDELTHFYNGGFYAADKYLEKNEDLTIFNCYYVKKHRTYFITKGIKFSELKEKFSGNYDAMADAFCKESNEMGIKYRAMDKIEIKKLLKNSRK